MAEQSDRVKRRNAQCTIEEQMRKVAVALRLQLGPQATKQDDAPQHQPNDKQNLPEPAKVEKFQALSPDKGAQRPFQPTFVAGRLAQAASDDDYDQRREERHGQRALPARL